jgi:hypothetical protein
MTLVHVVLTVPESDGSLTPAAGALRFRPTARRTIAGTPDTVVLPAPFRVDLVAGAADVTLAPTSSLWVWQIDEHLTGCPARRTYAQVPDVAVLDYTDLVSVDPTTLDPAPAPDPSWAAAMNLQLARTPEAIISGTISRDSGGAPLSAPVTWPDGLAGVFTGTPSPTFAGALDAYTITHGTTTYTQPAVTRNASGAITDQPAITVS